MNDIVVLAPNSAVAVETPRNIYVSSGGSQGPAGFTYSDLTTTGLVVCSDASTNPDTLITRSIAGAANKITITNADGIAGNPTIDISASYVGQTSIVTTGTVTTGTWSSAISGSVINSSIIGATTPNTGKFTTLETTGLVGIGVAPNATSGALLSIGSSALVFPSSSATIFASSARYIAPSTATAAAYGFQTAIDIQNAAFTIGVVAHYDANTVAGKGASAGVTTVYGYIAQAAIAYGATNYGFWSGIAAATNNYAIYGSGTAQSFLAGPLGLGTNPTVNTCWLIAAGVVPGTGAIASGIQSNATYPSTATNFAAAYYGLITITNASFTCSNAVGFWANSFSKGASATVTNCYGFRAESSISNIGATNTYAYYSGLASGSNTYAFYGAGTALSYLAGGLGLGTSANTVDIPLRLGQTGIATGSSQYGSLAAVTANSSATSILSVYNSQGGGTANSAFTCTDVVAFHAQNFTKGAASTITNIKGFWAANAIVVGTNNYGFYSDIVNATNTYQLNMSGTAPSSFGGSVTIVNGGTSHAYCLGTSGVHANTSTVIYGIQSDITAPSTTTGNFYNFRSVARTSAVAFTLGSLVHYFAENTIKGATSTINNMFGFYAPNAIANGTVNYGFYSDINVATTTYQLYMAGTAPSLFGGAVIEKEITVTYSASMTIDARLGNEQIITANNGTAFTINAPANPATGQYLELTIRNTSGGALGVITWDVVFKMTAWTSPATAFSRTIIFRYNGANWIEKGRTAADVPN